jgi:hypothetical protein
VSNPIHPVFKAWSQNYENEQCVVRMSYFVFYTLVVQKAGSWRKAGVHRITPFVLVVGKLSLLLDRRTWSHTGIQGMVKTLATFCAFSIPGDGAQPQPIKFIRELPIVLSSH